MIMSSNICVSLSITLILSVIFCNDFTLGIAFWWPRCSQPDCIFDGINYFYNNSIIRRLSLVRWNRIHTNTHFGSYCFRLGVDQLCGASALYLKVLNNPTTKQWQRIGHKLMIIKVKQLWMGFMVLYFFTLILHSTKSYHTIQRILPACQ